MLKENQKIKIMPYGANIEYYKSLGYNFEKGESILISPEELPSGSKVKVQVICDGCGKEYTKEYKTYLRDLKKYEDGSTYCIHCAAKTNQAKANKKQSNLNKYGVYNVSQVPEIKEKIKTTCLQKYGSNSHIESDHYYKTIKDKYGVDYILQNHKILSKARESFYKNGTCATSSQQIKIRDMLNDLYSECFLNFPCDNYSLDCMVVIDNQKLDIEYDCWYWHQNQNKDKERDNFVLSKGYKILRIKAGKKIPDINQLKQAIDCLISDNNCNYSEIILDNKEIIK